MKKKFLTSLLLVLLISLTSVVSTYAEMSSFSLTPGMTSATTSRITVNSGEVLDVTILMHTNNSTPLTYTIFKSGVAYTSGSVSTSTRFVEKTLSVPTGDYSLRVYCNSKSSPKTSCTVNGGLSDLNN